MYPETQKKAQLELDRVVGKGRLPEFSDLDSLPYINAIVKEGLRWKPTAPLGLPHLLREDDVFDGKFIPAGAIVIANVWSVFFLVRCYLENHLLQGHADGRKSVGESQNLLSRKVLDFFRSARPKCKRSHKHCVWIWSASSLEINLLCSSD